MTSSQTEMERFKLKKQLQELERASGSGTSMITLLIPPKQIPRASKMLTQEYAVSSNIKSRV